MLADEHVSGEHARIVLGGDGYVLRDLRSTNGTAVLRADARIALDDGERARGGARRRATSWSSAGGEQIVRLAVTIAEDAESDARASWRCARSTSSGPPRRPSSATAAGCAPLYDVQKRIGGASDLSDVLVAICDGAFALVPGATHVTVVLREDEEGAPSYVPIVTRVRGQQGPATEPIPITRSVFRKVVSERAAVIAADAPREVGADRVADGRADPQRARRAAVEGRGDPRRPADRQPPERRRLHGADLDVCAVLAHHASLAVANARLVQRLRAAEERLKKENTFLKTREESRRGGKGEAGDRRARARRCASLFEQLDKVVDTRVTVLIEGETGVGKELIAAAVHYRSRRRGQAVRQPELRGDAGEPARERALRPQEGQLHRRPRGQEGPLRDRRRGDALPRRGDRDAASRCRASCCACCRRGRSAPSGATQEKRVNVRIVAATNRNLEKEVAEGRFREDLYYRLKVFPIRVPPLRERREDIPLLAKHFLKRYSAELGKPAAGFSQQAMELLQAYDWPGNVRELQNEVQRLVIQIDAGRLRHAGAPVAAHPPDRGRDRPGAPTKGTLKEMMDQLERWLLIESLREHDNNKTAAAKSLGITREGLHKKLRAFGL